MSTVSILALLLAMPPIDVGVRADETPQPQAQNGVGEGLQQEGYRLDVSGRTWRIDDLIVDTGDDDLFLVPPVPDLPSTEGASLHPDPIGAADAQTSVQAPNPLTEAELPGPMPAPADRPDRQVPSVDATPFASMQPVRSPGDPPKPVTVERARTLAPLEGVALAPLDSGGEDLAGEEFAPVDILAADPDGLTTEIPQSETQQQRPDDEPVAAPVSQTDGLVARGGMAPVRSPGDPEEPRVLPQPAPARAAPLVLPGGTESEDIAQPKPKPNYHDLFPLMDVPPAYEPWKQEKPPVDPFINPYTSEETPLYLVLLEAVRRSPDVAVARAKLNVASSSVDISKAVRRPSVSVRLATGKEMTDSNGEGQVTRQRSESGLTIRQLIHDFGVSRFDVRRNRSLEESASFILREEVQAVSLQAAEAVLQILESEKLIRFAKENINAHVMILDLVRLRFEAGNGTEADVQRVEARLSKARAELVDLEGRLRQAFDRYRRLLGEEPGRLAHPAPPEGLLPPDELDAIDLAAMRNPNLLTLRSDLRSLENQFRSNKGNFFPRIQFEAQANTTENVSGETGTSRDMRGMVTMSYNLYEGGRRKAVSQQILGRIDQLNGSYRLSLEDLEESIRSGFTAVTAARTQQAEIRQEIEANLKVNELYLQQFEAGQRNVFDLLDGQQNLFDSQKNLTTNTYNEFRSSYRILERIGILLESLIPDEFLQ